MFGSHLSIAGSMVNALEEAEKLTLDTVQVFTKNQQQWKAKPLDPGVVRDWRARLEHLGWQDRTVSHASYLINLGSPDDALWRKSIDLMTDEIERCQTLGIPFLVHHPGAYTTSTREEGLGRIALAYRELFARTNGSTVVSCLENTVGGGSNIGREFEELARLRDLILNETSAPKRLGICFDTCHAHAGGYDLSTIPAATAAMESFEKIVGLKWIRVLHLNDSKAKLGSRLDRHQHIGQGTIGEAGFKVAVNTPAFKDVPKIMETPKGDADDGTPLDTLNLRRLWSYQKRKPIEQPQSGSDGGTKKPKMRRPASRA
jgi:deoxyribonuclease IV